MTPALSRKTGWQVLCLVSTALGLSAGCERRPQTFPVTGKVQYADGTPCERATVEFKTTGADGEIINARGIANDRGEFTLSTFAEADGAMLGQHAAVVIGDTPLPSGSIRKARPVRIVPASYGRYETSKLNFTVEPKHNHFSIVLD